MNSSVGTYYVRLGANYTSEDAADPLGYASRVRPAPIRALWSEKISFALSATITVDSQPAYTATIPLYATSHDSTQQGENFVTSLDLIWQNTYVKVLPNSTISLQFDGKYSKDVQTGALSAGLRVAKVAVGALAPEASILTTLNQSKMQSEAKLWDSAVGELFGRDASETIKLSTSPEQVVGQSCGRLTLFAPGHQEGIDPNTQKIGEWRVGILDWRRSLFSLDACLDAVPTSACAASVTAGLTPIRVLNEPVGGGETIASFLAKQDVTEIAAAKTDAVKDQAAASFCRKAASALAGLGLTDVDAKLGLWAFVKGQPLAGDVAQTLAANSECGRVASPFTF